MRMRCFSEFIMGVRSILFKTSVMVIKKLKY
jgi:hypothetical protein